MLDDAASEFYADLRLSPVLRQVLRRSSDLLGAVAGSISIIRSSGDRYAKMAEHGARCQLGQTFPLDEGVTGQVVARRRPVVLGSYGDVVAGHLPQDHPASKGAVVAVPIWWRGEIIGANVVFAGRRRDFTTAEVDDLELLTQVSAPAIVKAGQSDPSLAHLIRAHSRPASFGVRTCVVEVGPVRAVAPQVAGAAVDLVAQAEGAASRHDPAGRLHVAVVYRPDGVRLLLQDEASLAEAPTERPDPLGAGAQSWHVLAARAGGGLTVERVPGWGTLVRADFPYDGSVPAPPEARVPAGSSPVTGEPGQPVPFTGREREVLTLLARGVSNREIAATLVLSPKTVEKHVAAILRKTGTSSRTAAVMRAAEAGWLTSVPRRGTAAPA